MSHTIHNFPNGLRLIHEQHTSGVAHFGILINAGTRDETADIMGMAHFIEHMLFKGTKKRRSLQIINRLEEVGGELNAYTTKDKTCVYASFTAEYIDRAVDLLTDVVFNSVFPEKEMEKEKKVILEEIDMYADNPEECIHDEFQELLFKDHPLGYNILGTPQTVNSFTQKEINKFISDNYLPGNIVFSYVGPTPFDKVAKLCEKYTSVIKGNPGISGRKKFTTVSNFTTIKKAEHAQCYCTMGSLAYHNTHPLRYPMGVLNNLLGGPGLNSRLNLAVREKYGYAYQIDSSYSAYEDTGYFSIYFGTDAKYLNKTLKVVEKELKRLREEELTEKALFKYKKQMAGQLLLGEENKSALMLVLGKNLLDYNKCETLDEVIQKVMAVTPEQVSQAANEVLAEDKLCRLVYENNDK